MQGDAIHLPQGALRQSDGSVVWRIWAPSSAKAWLVTSPAEKRREIAMTAQPGGYFVHREPQAAEGMRYLYRLADGGEYPDPASRWQPEGVHRPSALFSPQSYAWSDAAWRGVAREDLVIYELHVGTFTPEGTFDAAVPRLPALAELGITAIELMPIAQFPGERGWGYDGVYPCAAQNSYGGPRGLQRLVDAAHQHGLAVILDVVYNHLGPEGNYFERFGPYFTPHYHTPWGKAINYDGPDSDAVRQFFIDNACGWVRDFHLDGLRLDAVQTIYDFSPRHILADIQAAVQAEVARGDCPDFCGSGDCPDFRGSENGTVPLGGTTRPVYVIAETDQNDVRLVAPPERGGYGLDGVWSDDFHHSVHALLTGEHDGYYADFRSPRQVAKALSDVFVYDGCYSPYRRRRHGTRAEDIERTRFVVCVQNHDQIGNRALGERLISLVPPAAQRLATALLLLSPCVPLLFMGEEYGERNPFAFFSSFDDPALIEAVRRGRREEFAALMFRWGVDIPDPHSPETFNAAKLAWSWPAGSPQAQLRRLYQDLLAARRRWPALRDRRQTAARMLNVSGAEQGDLPVLLLRRGGEQSVLAVANLTASPIPLAAVALVETRAAQRSDSPCEETPPDCNRGALKSGVSACDTLVLLSTEDARYGGDRAGLPPPVESGAGHRGSGGRGQGAEIENLTSANLESPNLESANLTSPNLESPNLESANLKSANLTSANLKSQNPQISKSPNPQIPKSPNPPGPSPKGEATLLPYELLIFGSGGEEP